MTLRELIIILRNLEGVGANRGERGGGDRRLACVFGDNDVNERIIRIAEIGIAGGDVVLRLCEE